MRHEQLSEAEHDELLRVLEAQRPRSSHQLHGWIEAALGITVPRAPVLSGHDAPFSYLCHSFFEPGEGGEASPRDCVVWAARGAGKTFYAAVATALDLVFKPSVEVRLLAGSLEQGQRMYAHLRALFERPVLRPLVAGRPTERRFGLLNGSLVSLLAASHTSVRGVRPQILRCDEVDLFDADVWQAAQLTTRSKRCGGMLVRGRVEALSTWHRPAGLMSELVGASGMRRGDESTPRRVFRWSVVDVLGACAPGRTCEGCDLRSECAGRARQAGGHIPVEDAITLKRRTDEATWEAEMLCERPRRTDAVFPEFDPAVHVFAHDGHEDIGGDVGVVRIAGMDFGFRNPTVMLVATLDAEGVLRIIEERVKSETTIGAHIEWLGDRARRPSWVGVDPAGHQRSEHTGRSNIGAMRAAGLTVRSRRCPLELGLRAVRARLRPASGSPMLFIHAGCERLIASLRSYRYPDAAGSSQPVKDGHDHAADALRYLIVNLDLPYRERNRSYLGS